MNRREFLRSLALVPVALATKVQVEPKPVSEAYKFRTINEIALGESPSETFAKIGKKVFDGYVEGVQVFNRALLDSEVYQIYSEGCVGGVRWYPSDRDEYGESNWKLEMLGNRWNSENCDPIADLQAVTNYVRTHRGI